MAAWVTDGWRRLVEMSAAGRIITLNVAIFLILRLLGIIAMIGGWSIDSVVDRLAMPSDPSLLASRPWTAATYMVCHYDPFHLLFNMLALYWFAKLMTFRTSARSMVMLYIYGGLAGALFYFAGAQAFASIGGWLLGASASVMAIVIAVAVMMPDYPMRFLFIGSVRMKWVALAAVVLFALGLVGNNAGAHVAHFGGIICGFIYGMSAIRGVDITRPVSRLSGKIAKFCKSMFNRLSRTRRKGKFNPRPRTDAPSADDDRRNLDEILDKIKHSGYTALTPEERRQLFEISRRIK